ncbi:uncharacterized protein LOC113217702 isoform X2 [Frankliniella occidentalis]|uniref:Uncharacterized protein LOC113217702 isoform X2 n=1 Tax=Frankliniella occidentalis TaxID=133901 RepID=A0A6J1TS41_FRAOC|nr:uncharacterized protein LOC113217702 isoform X2 [Frankliniella occidentalis]
MFGEDAAAAEAGPAGPPSALSLLAVLASAALCWVLYRVRMRQCEAVLDEMGVALENVRRTAAALETRRRVVKAAAVTAEKALKEYDEFLAMLRKIQEEGRPRPDLPVLRHQLDVETVRARVSMVQGSLLAMSQEVLSLGALPASVCPDSKKHRKSYTHMSEELLTLLDERVSEHVSDALFSAPGTT